MRFLFLFREFLQPICDRCMMGTANNEGTAMKQHSNVTRPSTMESAEILVYLDWRYGSARDICEGVLRYAALRPGWNVVLWGNVPPENGAVLHRRTRADGIVSGFGAIRDLRGVRSKRTRAVVFLTGSENEARCEAMADICPDDTKIGLMAAEFFLKRGFDSFGFVDIPCTSKWAKERGAAFCGRLAADGMEGQVFRSPLPAGGLSPDGKRLRKRLAEWIVELPKPAAVFCANDIVARLVLEVCARCGVSVPDQVSLLGVDDEFWVCEGSRPTLSSVALDFTDAGFKAAEVLDAMMRGGSSPEQTIRFGVREIVERGSTGDSHGFRRTVRLALDYMRRNIAWRDLRVDHLAAAANCSRSHLEKSFRIANGTSPADALREIRLSSVCELLRRTDKPLDRIAALCGFAPLHLKKAFRKRYGMTMGEFRRVNRDSM